MQLHTVWLPPVRYLVPLRPEFPPQGEGTVPHSRKTTD